MRNCCDGISGFLPISYRQVAEWRDNQAYRCNVPDGHGIRRTARVRPDGRRLQGAPEGKEELKPGQIEIQKTLQSLKELLAGKQAAPSEVFIHIDGAASLGETGAKLVMVSFRINQCPYRCPHGFAQKVVNRAFV